MSNLPRYLMREVKPTGVIYRYNPPSSAIQAGVVESKSLGNNWKIAYKYADEQNKILDEWRGERKRLKNLSGTSTVTDLLINYRDSLGFQKLEYKTRSDYDYYLSRWLNDRVGGVPLAKAKLGDILTPMCQRIYDTHATSSVSLANHSLAVYKLLFNHAIRNGYTTHNPFTHILRRADKQRKVVWEKEHVAAFLTVAYSEFRLRNVGLIVQMAYEWGQRLGDVRLLKWSNYDSGTGTLSLEQSKRGASVSLPTSENLREMLEQQHKDFGWQQYIAPSTIRDMQGGLLPYSANSLARIGGRIMDKAGIPKDILLMDLRRTAVTEMIEAEVPLPNIMAMTGHATPQSVAPYMKHTLKGATVAARMRGFV